MTLAGLRPGEKLYEELLVKTEELDKTSNNKIIILPQTVYYTSDELGEREYRITNEILKKHSNTPLYTYTDERSAKAEP